MCVEIVRERVDEVVSMLEYVGRFIVNEQKKGNYSVMHKDDGSLLTDLDIMSNELIKNELVALFGDIGVLSEENNESDNIEVVNNKHYFLLDPIDGSENFNQGKEFTINLAFCVCGVPKIGIIHHPLERITLFGDGNIAFKKTKNKTVMLAKAERADKEKVCSKKSVKLSVGKHNFQNKKFISKLVELFINKGYNMSVEDIKPRSAMGKVFAIVNKDVDAFFVSKQCKDWDVLPCLPIINAIGLKYYTQNPKVYNNHNFCSGTFFCANNQALLDDIIDISKQMIGGIASK